LGHGLAFTGALASAVALKIDGWIRPKNPKLKPYDTLPGRMAIHLLISIFFAVLLISVLVGAQ
jgi:hypothetical protein